VINQLFTFSSTIERLRQGPRKASTHTLASYRDTFRELLQFAQKRLRKAPSQLGLGDLDAPLVGAFLEDLGNRRHNSARSRNLRLTAIRSFFRYASLEAPAHSGIIQRVLAIPNQRQRRTLIGFLTRPEIEALLAAPNRTQWLGRRDHAFLLTPVQTGLRLSEMTGLRHEDISLSDIEDPPLTVGCRIQFRDENLSTIEPMLFASKQLDLWLQVPSAFLR
jgi:integrase/recombinase XerD